MSDRVKRVKLEKSVRRASPYPWRATSEVARSESRVCRSLSTSLRITPYALKSRVDGIPEKDAR